MNARQKHDHRDHAEDHKIHRQNIKIIGNKSEGHQTQNPFARKFKKTRQIQFGADIMIATQF